MAVIFTSKQPWTRRPSGIIEPNWDNPRMQDCLHWLPINNGLIYSTKTKETATDTNTTRVGCDALGGIAVRAGSLQYASVAGSAVNLNQGTLAAWVRRSSASNTIIISHLNLSAGGRFSLDIWSDGNAYLSVDAGTVGRYSTATCAPSLNEWHRVVLTYDNSAASTADYMKFYVDGRSITLAESTVTGSAITGSASHILSINRDHSGVSPFTARYGSADYAEVGMWMRAWSPSEVWEDYDPRTRWELYSPRIVRKYFINSGSSEPTNPTYTHDDDVAVTESITRSLPEERSTSDSITVAEDISRSLPEEYLASDSITVTEDVTKLLPEERATSDSISVTEDIARTLPEERSLSDSASITERVSRSLPEEKSLSDSVAATESIIRSLPEERSLSDSVSITESVTSTLPEEVSLFDTASVLEDIARLLFDPTLTRSVEDAIAVTEKIFKGTVRSVSDSIAVRDSATRLMSGLPYTSASDTLIQFYDFQVRLDVKQETDSGLVDALSTDTNGTEAFFNKSFKDIESIVLTVNSTSFRIAIYSFYDVPDPTSFFILVFDQYGNRTSDTVSWVARGIIGENVENTRTVYGPMAVSESVTAVRA